MDFLRGVRCAATGLRGAEKTGAPQAPGFRPLYRDATPNVSGFHNKSSYPACRSSSRKRSPDGNTFTEAGKYL